MEPVVALDQVPASRAAAAYQLAPGMVHAILANLQQLPFRRVDVSFEGDRHPNISHYHILIRVPWLNKVGVSIANHLAKTLGELEDHLKR